MQTWLYEIDSAIEFRIGASQIDGDNLSNYFIGGKIGFYLGDNLDFGSFTIGKLYAITTLTPPNFDSITIADFIANNFKGLLNYPDSGTVIRLAPIKQNVGINKIQLNDNIIINHVIDQTLSVQLLNNFSNHQLSIVDISGKVVLQQHLFGNNNTINCNHLPSGNYIVGIANKNASVYYQVIKK
jgi:Secretion system C-terminal sorting domain